MPMERWCQVCGSVNQADEVLCLVCGRSLKTTQPLHAALQRGRYHVQEQVGVGGFSAVYKALDTIDERVVAIKAVGLQGLDAQKKIEATDAFNREVQFLSQLAHRSLPRIYDHFSEADCWYVVMDFIAGSSLEHYLEDAPRRMTVDEVLDLGLALCEVLEYLHTRGIIFRDLKPSNVMLTHGGRLYLIDFGIARRFIPGRQRDTQPFGSPGYAAPEQYGRTQTTPCSDIYSLGAMLHQMLTTGHPALTPFQFAPIRQSNPAVPAELEELIGTMVELDATRRPESVATVKERLRGIAQGSGALYARSAGNSSPGIHSIDHTIDRASGGGAAASMTTGKLGQVYYIPSDQLPLASWRLVRALWRAASINFLLNLFLLYMTYGSVINFGTGNFVNPYFPFPFVIFMLPFVGGYLFPLLNIIGLLSGHLGLRRARRVFRQRFEDAKMRRAAKLAKTVNGCGLVMGYLVLVLWVLLVLILFIAWLPHPI